MTLGDVLSTYVGSHGLTVKLGEGNITRPEGAAQPVPAISISDLRSQISEVGKSNTSYFRVCFILLVVLFLGCGALVFNFLNEPSKAGAVFGVTGLSFLGIIAQMLRLWKQKVASDLTLALASSLPPQQLLTALETILKELRT
jgi:hypothetical protein